MIGEKESEDFIIPNSKVKLFDKLREKKFSVLVSAVRESILSALKTDKFTAETRAFFTHFNPDGCGLIKVTKDPTTTPLEEIRAILKNQNGIILHNDVLYYVDQPQCALVSMATDPTLCTSEELSAALRDGNGVILFDNKLFAANSSLDSVTEIPLPDSEEGRHAYLQLKTKFNKPFILADLEERQLIENIGGPPVRLQVTTIEVPAGKRQQLGQLRQIINSLADNSYKRADADDNALITALTGRMHPECEPFSISDLSDEPEQVSQVKKVLIALHCAELALLDLEKYNIRTVQGKKVFATHTTHLGYVAAQIGLHFDMNLKEVFSDEFALLAPLFNTLKDYSQSLSTEARGFLQQDFSNIPHQIGVVGGTIIDQIDPKRADQDVDLLARVTAFLPNYLDKLSDLFQKFSSNITVHRVDKNQLKDLQDHAKQLFNALQETRGSSLFFSFKALHYIHIIEHVYKLSMSIVEQAAHLTDSAQDAVREKLAELKYNLLPMVFGITDKIEAELMLTPGTLSSPLMKHVTGFYDSLITFLYKTHNIVDFSEKGQELLSIEDSKFLSARAEFTFKRIAEDKKVMCMATDVQSSIESFYEVLERPEFKGQRILDLPVEDKKELIEHYKRFQPYVIELNPSLNDVIVESLTREKKQIADTVKGLGNRALRALVGENSGNASVSSSQSRPLGGIETLTSWLKGGVNTVKKTSQALIRKVIGDPKEDESITAMKVFRLKLDAYVNKILTSRTFHSKLGQDILENALTTSEKGLKLLPYDPCNNPYAINEETILGLNQNPPNAVRFELVGEMNQVVDLRQISLEQVLTLFKVYSIKYHKLEMAKKAYGQFHRIISEVDSPARLEAFNAEQKTELRHLYYKFQPYFVSVAGVAMDALIAKILTAEDPPAAPIVVPGVDDDEDDIFYDAQEEEVAPSVLLSECRAFNPDFDAHLVSMGEQLSVRSTAIIDVFLDKIDQDNEAKPLNVESQSSRANRIIRHQEFSQSVNAIRQTLEPFLVLFNDRIRAQLIKQEDGLPFPEMEDINNVLAESSQIRALKRILNCLYYLERGCAGLEQLKENSLSEIDFVVFGLVPALSDLKDAISVAMDLAETPYLAVIAREIKDKVLQTYAKFQDLQGTYFPDADEVVPAGHDRNEDAMVEHPYHTSIHYALNVLHLMPEHMKAWLNGQALSDETKQEIYQRTEAVTVDVERIMNKSDSYLKWKLIFEIPTMYSLFQELKQKLAVLTNTAHGAVLEHLDAINNDLLTKMLQEADRYEDSMGLKLGTLTEPLKGFVDAFYQGLLEPLHLHSQRYVALTSSITPISKRMADVKKRAENAIFAQDGLPCGLMKMSENPKEASANHLRKLLKNKPAYVLYESTVFYVCHDVAPRELAVTSPDKLTEIFTGAVNIHCDASKEHLEKIFSLTGHTPGLKLKLALLQTLLDNIRAYKEGHSAASGSSSSADEVSDELSEEDEEPVLPPTPIGQRLIESYRAAFPLLIDEKAHLLPLLDVPRGNRKSRLLDLEINTCSGQPHLTDIEDLTQACTSYFKGLIASEQLIIDTAEEKLSYLDNLKHTQLRLNEDCRMKYTTRSFKRQAATLAEKQVGILMCRDEYKKELAKYLQAAETEIVAASESKEDIDKRVGELLSEKVKEFERINYRDYYHLETIREVIRRMQTYASDSQTAINNHRSIFENQDTLNEKIAQIEILNGHATNEGISVAERIKIIRETVLDMPHSFKTPMQREQRVGMFTWTWFAQCLALLAELLWLYTPERKKCYNALVKAIEPPKNIAALSAQFGIFAGPAHSPVEAAAQEAAPEAEAPAQVPPVVRSPIAAV